MGLRVPGFEVCLHQLLNIICMTCGKLFNLFEPQFPYLKSGINNSSYPHTVISQVKRVCST